MSGVTSLEAKIYTSIAWLLVIYTAIDQAGNCLIFYNYPPSAGYWDFICFHKEPSLYWCLCFLSKENLVQQEHITSQNSYSYRVIPEQGNKLSVLTWRRRLHWWAEMEGVVLPSPDLVMGKYPINYSLSAVCCVLFLSEQNSLFLWIWFNVMFYWFPRSPCLCC